MKVYHGSYMEIIDIDLSKMDRSKYHNIAGSKIRDGAIIGMKSVMGNGVELYTIAAGNPAKKYQEKI